MKRYFKLSVIVGIFAIFFMVFLYNHFEKKDDVIKALIQDIENSKQRYFELEEKLSQVELENEGLVEEIYKSNEIVDKLMSEIDNSNINDIEAFEINENYKYMKFRSGYKSAIENIINNVISENHNLEEGARIIYYICKLPNVSIIDEVAYITPDAKSYPINHDELIFYNSAILIDIKGTKYLINNSEIEEYNEESDIDKLAYNVIDNNSMIYSPIKSVDPFYSNFIPIVYNNYYIGGVKNTDHYINGIKDRVFFDTQDKSIMFGSQSEIQLDELTGNEQVKVIVDGIYVEDSVLTIPGILNTGYNRFIITHLSEYRDKYLALGAKHELHIYNARKVNDDYKIDIDGDGDDEIFTWIKDSWVLLDSKYFHYYSPFTVNNNPGPELRNFEGFFIDINGDGILEHVIITDTIPDFNSIKIYDLRLEPSANPIIEFIDNGVN